MLASTNSKFYNYSPLPLLTTSLVSLRHPTSFAKELLYFILIVNFVNNAITIYSPGKWPRFGNVLQQIVWILHLASHSQNILYFRTAGTLGVFRSFTWRPMWKWFKKTIIILNLNASRHVCGLETVICAYGFMVFIRRC